MEHSEAIENPKQYIQQSAMTYLDSPTGTQSQTSDQPMSTLPEPESTLPEPESTLPEPPVECADSHTPVPTANSNDPDWLSRMKSEEQA